MRNEQRGFYFLKVAIITLLHEENILAKKAFISHLTAQGFHLLLSHKDLIPLKYKNQLSLDSLINQKLSLYIPLMEIDLEVTVLKTRHLGKGNFEIQTEFLTELPLYWRECLLELWPKNPKNSSLLIQSEKRNNWHLQSLQSDTSFLFNRPIIHFNDHVRPLHVK